MKVGDLVICASVSGRPLGIIVKVWPSLCGNTQYKVKMQGHDTIYPFDPLNLEVINESR